MAEPFEAMLTGGHPNSLGRTEEVVEQVLAQPERFDELFDCYRSEDAIVRMRTSSAMKRVEARNHALLVPYVDRFISQIGKLDQPSAQWTLAQLFDRLTRDMNEEQKAAALVIMKRNLASHHDWIVLNTTMEILSSWATGDEALRGWLKPHLERLSLDSRKSVAKRARKACSSLYSE